MAQLQPARTLPEAYRNCDPMRPLQGEWLRAFYVERPPDSRADRVLDELRMDASEDDKTLFSGQQGAGESTELYRLEQMLQADEHLTIFFSADQALNLGDLHYTDLLVLLGLEVYQVGRRQGISASDRKAQDLLFWYRERVLEQDEAERLQSEVGAEINLGLIRLAARLAQDAPFRETVRARAEAGLSDLLVRLNDLLQEIRNRAGRRILVIVDGLDKVYDLRQAASLFLYGANALLAPACRVIYTVPFPLFYSPDFQQVRQQFHRQFLLPNIKTHTRQGEPYPAGRNMLKEVVLRRIHHDLITEKALDALVEASGGLLRELMRLARYSILAVRRRNGNRILPQDILQARREVRNTFRRILHEEDYAALWQVYNTKRINALEPDLADRLLHNLSVLEYNGDTWWDVHPAVRDLLHEAREEQG